MTLGILEYTPFLFFITHISLPVELVDRWVSGNKFKCALTMPADFDPAVLEQMWNDWMKESMTWDYASLN